MSQCPVCQTAVPDDFGLIECTGCKTPLFVQMDGSVQSMAEKSHVTSVSKITPPENSKVTSTSMNLSEMLVDEAMSASQPSIRPPLPDEAIPEDSMGMSEANSEPIVGIDEEPALPPPLPEEEEQGQLDAPEASDVDAFFDEPEPAVVEPQAPINDLSNLANETEAQNGSLRYNILIAGIDTADIRKEFRDVISDRRFLWDADGILKSIQAGKVRMRDISAVKAILLMHRLRSLPVHVQWEQHVIHID